VKQSDWRFRDRVGPVHLTQSAFDMALCRQPPPYPFALGSLNRPANPGCQPGSQFRRQIGGSTDGPAGCVSDAPGSAIVPAHRPASVQGRLQGLGRRLPQNHEEIPASPVRTETRRKQRFRAEFIAPSASGRAELRGWRSQDRRGSNPLFRTNL
jgi:hypothetical protein